MKRLIAIAALALLSIAPATSSAGMITLTQGSTKVKGYLAIPPGEGTHPAIVVIHEWWGLNDWVKEQADRLAKEGYVALAVDIYHGQVAKDDATAHQLMSGLDENEAMNTLRAATDFLRGRSDVRANAIGVIGWCMGGGYSIRLAAADPGIRACVMYYGAPISDPAAIRGLQAAVLGNFGGEDKGPSPDQVRTFEKALKQAGKRVDFKIYPGAPHAFANVHNPWGGYREAAAKDAWLRTKAFLRKELKMGSLPRRSRAG
ncbi:MAG TPA: dienelactone hydrolase family protein [Candidatus Omnitrophota bacterium]|jgi:carboxymethylenebutenolidase|nr:dienelactone hydrolase family protein [Candidatus Omnitrophota bacterium]